MALEKRFDIGIVLLKRLNEKKCSKKSAVVDVTSFAS
jgi:hypothetical protein